MKKNILNDIYSNWMTGAGVLSILTDNTAVPWKTSVDGMLLDMEYHGNRSGIKQISPLISKMLTPEGLTDEQKVKLAQLTFIKFGKQWIGRWATLNFEYNPIENYSMIEETTRRTSSDGSASTSGSTESNASGSASNNAYGFNSTSAIPTDTQSSTDRNTSEVNSSSSSESSTNESERHIRTGNIGVMSAQDMINQEREVQMWDYFETVFSDIDTIFTNNIFGEACEEIYYNQLLDIIEKIKPATPSKIGLVKPDNNTIFVSEDGTIRSEGGITDYNELDNLPSINGVTLVGDKSLDQIGAASIDDMVLLTISDDINGVYHQIPTDRMTLSRFNLIGGRSIVSNNAIKSVADSGSIDLTITDTNDDEYNYNISLPSLRGINNIYDYIDLRASNLVRKCGIVDLGTCEWRTQTIGSFNVFFTINDNQKVDTPNIICAKYNTGIKAANLNDKEITCKGGAGIAIWVRDDAYSDAAAFKTAMSGVMLVYELATPTEEAITAPNNLFNTFYDGTITIDAIEGTTESVPVSITQLSLPEALHEFNNRR